jgi:hypothetical protein
MRKFALNNLPAEVRFGSKADMCIAKRHVALNPIAIPKADIYSLKSATRSRSALCCRWLTAAMNNHSPNLSRFGGGSALSGLAGGALATGSGDFAFAIFVSSLSRL